MYDSQIMHMKRTSRIPCYHLSLQLIHISCLTKYVKYLDTVTSVNPLQPTNILKYNEQVILKMIHCYLFPLFGAKLEDVFIISSSCTSHQPVAFCMFCLLLLIPVTAC